MSVEINVTDQIIEVTPTAGQIDVNITEIPVVVNATDQIIEIADTGLQGPQGPAGPGVPTGGTTGQILVKSSNTNFDTGWSSTNATLGEYGLSAGYLKVDTTPTNTPADQGTMYWDDNAETVALIMNGTIQKIGEDLFFHVQNKTGSPIPKGTCVRFAGTDGNSGKILIAPFIANGTYPSQYFMGVAAETIANGDNGKVYHFGKIRGVNTSAYQNGDILYASTTVAGGFQTSVPTAPNNIIIVAAVISAANNGTLMIRSTLGSNINNDEGVKITNPTNGQVLKYNSTTGLWENAVGGGTGTVTSVDASGGTGISVSGVPITTSGTITITNTAPDQVVGLTGAGTTSISGTYPNFTITSNDQYDGTVTSVDASGGTGISVSGGPITSSGSLTITNTAPDQVVSLTGTGTTSVSGTYPNFTVSSADQYVGTVTSVDASVPTGFSISGNPITTSGTLAIGFASGYSLPTNAKQTEWDSAYTNRITSLTTSGSSGAATLSSNTLNIPNYTLSGLGGVPSSRTLTVNGTGYDLSADRSWSVGTITSLTGEATASGSGAVSVTLDNASVIGKVLTGLNLTGGGTIAATDSILQAFGKVQNQISALVGSVQYEGVWNASTNSPTITSGTGSKGDYYVVNVAGSTTIDGISDWKIGDWIIFNGTTWDKVDNTDAVSSVNEFTGAVSLSTSNIGEGTNLYFTNTRAQNAITLTTSGTSGSATYSGGTLNIPVYSIALTTTGSSGAATLVGNTLNIPNYGSALSGYVPYTGANNDLAMGVYDISARFIKVDGESGNMGYLGLKQLGSGTLSALGYTGLSSGNSYTLNVTFAQSNGTYKYVKFSTFYWADNEQFIYQLPRANGTLALSSELGGYVPTTRTLTINGTSYDLSANRSWNVGTVTSITGGTGITGGTITTSGTLAFDTTWGDARYQQVLTNPVTGTGTTNYLPKFTGASTIGNSQIFDNGTGVGINTSSPSATLDVRGTFVLDSPTTGGGGNAYLEISKWTNPGGVIGYKQNLSATGWTSDRYFNSSGVRAMSVGVGNPSAFAFANLAYIIGQNNFPLIFGTGAGDLASEHLRITVDGNVGIGTQSPAYKLDVNGTLGVTGAATFSSSVTATNFYSTTSANGFNVDLVKTAGFGSLIQLKNTSSSSNELIRVLDASNNIVSQIFPASNGIYIGTGNLGLGVTPSAWFSGLKAIQFGTAGVLWSNSDRANLAANVFIDAATNPIYINNGYALRYAQEGGQHAWYTAPSGTAGNAITFTQAMTLDASGNLAIGTTSAVNSRLYVQNSGVANLIIGYNNTSVNYYDAGTHYFRTAGASNLMTLNSTGLGIGTTSPTQKLEVLSSSGNLYIQTTASDGSNAGIRMNSVGQREYGIFSDGALRFYDFTASTERMRITSGGEVYIAGTTDQGAYNLQVNGTGVWGAGAYVNGSDIRLKDNIKDIDEGLSMINRIRPVTFTYKENYSKDRNIQTGFIAQELQEVFKDKDYLSGLVQEGPEHLNVAYQNIIPVLVKAIQEQQIQIENLKKQIV